MNKKITVDGYLDFDSPFITDNTPSELIAPAIAPDSTKPDGMRKARYVNDSWIDEEGAQLAAELAAQTLAADNAKVIADLQAIDIASVRSIREWITAQPNPPQFLVDHEAAAQAKRAQLK